MRSAFKGPGLVGAGGAPEITGRGGRQGGTRKGLPALLATAVLWGSSFPAIKLAVSRVGGITYTWLRGLLSVLSLVPYVAYAAKRGRVDRRLALGGLATGTAYAIALWLQGWGMEYTTASNAAFITGLNVMFVHAYTAIVARSYGPRLAASLALSITGLYVLTAPSGGLNVGDLLVLLSAVFWAAQIILVDCYGRGDPLVFAFFETIPTLAFFVPDAITGLRPIGHEVLLWSFYLALACSDAAFTLQALGQRYVSPAAAAVVLLLEPVFAAMFAYVLLGELMMPVQAAGAGLIVLAMFLACWKREIQH